MCFGFIIMYIHILCILFNSKLLIMTYLLQVSRTLIYSVFITLLLSASFSSIATAQQERNDCHAFAQQANELTKQAELLREQGKLKEALQAFQQAKDLYQKVKECCDKLTEPMKGVKDAIDETKKQIAKGNENPAGDKDKDPCAEHLAKAKKAFVEAEKAKKEGKHYKAKGLYTKAKNQLNKAKECAKKAKNEGKVEEINELLATVKRSASYTRTIICEAFEQNAKESRKKAKEAKTAKEAKKHIADAEDWYLEAGKCYGEKGNNKKLKEVLVEKNKLDLELKLILRKLKGRR